jgi:hypothetical protein
VSKNTDVVWPDSSEVRLLSREAAEHRRAWGLVGGLCKTLISERGVKLPPSSEDQNKRLAALETKIVKQRRQLANLEECRTFERETERLLAAGLQAIVETGHTAKKDDTVKFAQDMLDQLAERKGPRPEYIVVTGHSFPIVDLS